MAKRIWKDGKGRVLHKGETYLRKRQKTTKILRLTVVEYVTRCTPDVEVDG